MNMQNDQPRFILTMEGPSVRGQVAADTQFLEQHGAYIEEFAVLEQVLEMVPVTGPSQGTGGRDRVQLGIGHL